MHSEGRLSPERFPWTAPSVLFCSAVVAAAYLALMRWRPLGSLNSPLSALAWTGVLAAAFVIPPLLVLLKGAVASRGVGDAPRPGPLALWAPPAGWPRDVVAGIVLGLLLAFMNGISIQLDLADARGRPPVGFAGLAWRQATLGDISVLLLALGFVAPVAEEIFFRGVLYPGLRKTLPTVPSVLVSSAAFGAAHFESMRLHAFLLGLVAAILVEYTGSLVPAILAHMGVNTGFVLFLANGGVLAGTVPFWTLVAGFCALNVLLFLLGQTLFGRPSADEPPAVGPESREPGQRRGG